jgi:hypothetical protein
MRKRAGPDNGQDDRRSGGVTVMASRGFLGLGLRLTQGLE